MKFESPTSSGKEAMTKVKVFFKVGQSSGSRSLGQKFWYPWKGLAKGTYIFNMKALPPLVRELWPRIKFFESRSNFKVKVTRSKILVPKERSCHKEHTCEI